MRAVLSAVLCAAAVSVLTAAAAGGGLSARQAADIDRSFIRSTTESLAATVDREYFDPDVASRVALAVRARTAEGRYDGAATLEALAGGLTRDLLALTGDRHLAVSIVRASSAAGPVETREVQGRRSNFGVRRVEILPGNVGLLELTSFYRPEEAADTIGAAMRVLQRADALILDMRGNSGGSPDTAALLASYLFDAPALPLFDIVRRGGSGARQYATSAPALPERNGSRPAWVLTSERTFSAGEGFASILQDQHRAEVVGARTPGAANPGRAYPLNDRLEVTVPNGKVRLARSGTNWEGTGVVPDVPAAAADALRVAHIRALGALIARAPGGAGEAALRRQLEILEKP